MIEKIIWVNKDPIEKTQWRACVASFLLVPDGHDTTNRLRDLLKVAVN